MNNKFALMALTGVLALASCNQGSGTAPAPTCTANQILVDGKCVTKPATPATAAVTVPSNPNGYTLTIRDAAGNVIPSSQYNALQPGSYTAVYSKDGYVSQEQKFTVTAGSTVALVYPTLLANPVVVTTGNVTVPSNPNGYTLTIRDAAGNVIPASQYGTLQPGIYTATYSKEGYVSQSQTFSVAPGSNIALSYPALQMAPQGAYYVDSTGKVVSISQADLNNAGQKFVFYAWLEDEDKNVNQMDLGNSPAPAGPDKYEIAPLGTQNLTAGYVGYRAADGKIYPVVGAAVRWDIVEDKSQTNVRFATADDGAIASGAIRPLDINDSAMSATTFTNRAAGNNARFPSGTDFPINNVTGVTTPDIDGFTWTALWVPASTAGVATITAVAEINGTEINKTVMTKVFAPSAKLSITKGEDAVKGLNEDHTFTITVRNTGAGAATNVRLNDVMPANGAPYSVGTVTSNGNAAITLNNQDGFDATFDLAPAGQPGDSITFTVPARSSDTGVYCDVATIESYENGAFGTVRPDGLSDEACLTVRAPRLSIEKTLVDAQGNPIANGYKVNPGTEVFAAITVRNGGDAAATNIVVTDRLTAGNDAFYALQTTGTDLRLDGDSGFTSAPFELAPGASKTFRIGAVVKNAQNYTDSALNGEYCDTANFTATSNNGLALNGTDQTACFEVVTPALRITKVNTNLAGSPDVNLYPNDSYISTINVANTGSGAAYDLSVSDILGEYSGVFAKYGSGTYTILPEGTKGSLSLAGNVVSAPVLTLQPGQSLVLELTSTIPSGAPAGEYCDRASFKASNFTPNPATTSDYAVDCVTVLNTISVATAMSDTKDPILANGSDLTILTSALAVETSSNQKATDNVIAFNFGSTDSFGANPGVFDIRDTVIYYDATPVRDEQTGQIVSDYTSATAVKLAEGVNYTVEIDQGAQQRIKLLQPLPVGSVVFARHTVAAPVGVAARAYNSGFIWTYTGEQDGVVYSTSATESTTVRRP
ncbi:hypothetical protein ACFP81_10005 [Deinococcus lacus]|uniref:DUF11 domain-containing protein n=1 Tax=Deinococcus lacus TaxID=392561 RepID=A0ABW1YGN1_9DEIO